MSGVRVLAALATTGLAAASQTDLCYGVSYDYNETSQLFGKHALIHPVSGWPASHAKVQGGYCGGAVAGEPIPFGEPNCTDCKWGSTTKNFDDCREDTNCLYPPYEKCIGRGYVNGGAHFYGYNVPRSASSNTGYQEDDKSDIYFVQDARDNIWLVLNHDMPNNGDGGFTRLAVESMGLPPGQTYVVQEDDQSVRTYIEPGMWDMCKDQITGECYAWDNMIGKGTFNWNWQSCCTDGMVMGPFPKENFWVTLSYTRLIGLKGFRFGDYNKTDNEVDFLEHPAVTKNEQPDDNMKPNFFKIEGMTCSDYCERAADTLARENPDLNQCTACQNVGGGNDCVWMDSGFGRYKCKAARVEMRDGSSGTNPPANCSAVGQPCKAGFYCPGGDSSNPLPCPAGYYCPAGTTDTDKDNFPCPAGYYCPAGTPDWDKDKLPCPAGHYCPEGTTETDKEAKPCAAGYYCPAGTTDTDKDKLPCPGGYWCPEGTVDTDKDKNPCAADFWCPAGTTDTDKESNPCPQGYKSLPASSAAEDCENNVCPKGFYCPGGEWVDPQPCPAGYYCPAGTSDTDKEKFPCPAGHYCPAGTSDTDKEKFPCPAGSYCPAGTTDTDKDKLPCPAGSYCPAGTTEADKDKFPCPAGHYCPAGTTDTDKDKLPCKQGVYCPAGTTEADKDKFPCPAGHYCPAGTTDTNKEKFPCEAGFYCPAGTAAIDKDQLPCPAGSYCPAGTTDTDKDKFPCPAGHYCPAGTTDTDKELFPCPAGYYCPAGTAEDQKDSNPCPAGNYCFEGTSDTDKDKFPCPAGHYCAAGTADDDKDKTPCAAGFYCAAGTSDTDKDKFPCPGGYWCPGGTTDTDKDKNPCARNFWCPAGTTDGEKDDNPCPEGFGSPSASDEASDCVDTFCPAGFYCPGGLIPTTGEPEPCPAGYWCGLGTSDEDKEKNPCAKAHYCPAGTTDKDQLANPCPAKSPEAEFPTKEAMTGPASCGMTSLCYRVWHDYNEDTKEYQSHQLMRPVSGFPEKHSKVTEGYCGGANAGDPIPHGEPGCTDCAFGKSKDFATCALASTKCIDKPYTGCAGIGLVNAGSMFYAYDSPRVVSSNNGYAEKEKSDFFFIQDAGNDVFLVMAHDAPANRDGGQIQLSVTSTGLGTDTYVAQKDDVAGVEYYSPGDSKKCQDKTTDCFAWDNTIGEGSFAWNYAPCCTDGVVLGPLPQLDFSMEFDYTKTKGIDAFRLGSYNSGGSMSFTEIPTSDHKFKIETFTCDDLCWDEFKKAFGAPAFGEDDAVSPVCGTAIPDIGELPTAATLLDFEKALRAAVKEEFETLDPNFCSTTCAAEAQRVANVCKDVQSTWARDMVTDMTELTMAVIKQCNEEDDSLNAAQSLAPVGALWTTLLLLAAYLF